MKEKQKYYFEKDRKASIFDAFFCAFLSGMFNLSEFCQVRENIDENPLQTR